MSGYAKSKGFVTRGVAQLTTSAAQTGIGIGNALNIFATVQHNSMSGLTVVSATQITLAAGKTYRLRARPAFYIFSAGAAGRVGVCFYNVTTSAYVGAAGLFHPMVSDKSDAPSPGAELTITLTADTTFEVRLSSTESGTVALRHTEDGGNPTSYVTIEEVEAYAALTPASTGMEIAGATAKTTPIDADSVGISDSADGGILKKLTWANLKATLLATAMTWTGKQTFSGFTVLGTGPAIKMKKLTGTTAAAEGGVTSIEHGLTVSKIISVSAQVTYNTGTGAFVQPGYNTAAEYQFYIDVGASSVIIELSATSSGQLLSKPVTVFIIYEE
jgi:hypothetical protein